MGRLVLIWVCWQPSLSCFLSQSRQGLDVEVVDAEEEEEEEETCILILHTLRTHLQERNRSLTQVAFLNRGLWNRERKPTFTMSAQANIKTFHPSVFCCGGPRSLHR